MKDILLDKQAPTYRLHDPLKNHGGSCYVKDDFQSRPSLHIHDQYSRHLIEASRFENIHDHYTECLSIQKALVENKGKIGKRA